MSNVDLKEIDLAAFRDFAKSLDIQFAPNITRTELYKKVVAHCDQTGTSHLLQAFLNVQTQEELPEAPVKAPVAQDKGVKGMNANKAKANALVRFKLVCNDPSKRNIAGEYFCIGNRKIGTIKRFIPYAQEFYENGGWHAEQAILNMLMSKECYIKRTTETTKGVRLANTKLEKIKMFTITILPQLTPEELQKLAKDQQTHNRVGE